MWHFEERTFEEEERRERERPWCIFFHMCVIRKTSEMWADNSLPPPVPPDLHGRSELISSTAFAFFSRSSVKFRQKINVIRKQRNCIFFASSPFFFSRSAWARRRRRRRRDESRTRRPNEACLTQELTEEEEEDDMGTVKPRSAYKLM